MRGLLLLPCVVSMLALVSACAPPPTYADTRATAVLAGCWPGNGATPPAITVTPAESTATPTVTVGPGTATATRGPTLTPLATTTPYPRCTPGPGEPTLMPFPTPVPPRPPYPTQKPDLLQGGGALENVLQLPGRTYGLSIAVHPTDGWPVLGMTQNNSLYNEPIRSFVRVFNPQANAWGPAQQVDRTDASSNGIDRFSSTVVGITGDNTIHVVWGASDRDHTDNDPPTSYLWYSASTDYGVTWSDPQQLASNCWVADSMATTAEGWIVVAARCYKPNGAGPSETTARMLVRQPDGTWQPPQEIGLGWYAAEGAVTIVGDGADARATVLRFGTLQTRPSVYLLSRQLADASGWAVTQRTISSPAGAVGERHYHPQSLVFPITNPDRSVHMGIAYMWADAYRTGLYALVSLDAGQTWGTIETIAYDGRDPADSGMYLQWVAPAYDPAANRLIAIYTCCGDDAPTSESTHYAAWSAPHSGVWTPQQLPTRPISRIPLVVGSRAAWNTVSAQAPNGRATWLAWVEQENQIHVRTINLNQIVPVQLYPTPTVIPTPTLEATP